MVKTILIADDHDDNRELLQLLLIGAGYEVHEARNGSECLTLARDVNPDLIMVDLSMPVMDGWTMFEELRSDEVTKSIPCMAVTANADLDRVQALQSGFIDYVSKPFRGDVLLKAVADVLNKVHAN